MRDMSIWEKSTHLLTTSGKKKKPYYTQEQQCTISKQLLLFWCLREVCEGETGCTSGLLAEMDSAQNEQSGQTSIICE